VVENNNIRFRDINDIIDKYSKNNKTIRPNKFNNFTFFYYPLKNINNNIIFNNNIIHRRNKKAKNNFILNKKNNKFNVNFKVDNQESISHLSTTSEGDYNNYSEAKYFSKDFNGENQNNKNKNLFESIQKAIKDIEDYYNSNPNKPISLACYYYCNINIKEQQKNNLENQIKKININNN